MYIIPIITGVAGLLFGVLITWSLTKLDEFITVGVSYEVLYIVNGDSISGWDVLLRNEKGKVKFCKKVQFKNGSPKIAQSYQGSWKDSLAQYVFPLPLNGDYQRIFEVPDIELV